MAQILFFQLNPLSNKNQLMRTLIILTTMTCALFVQAQEMKFAKFTSLDDAVKQAKTEGKPIFVDTYASWCGWCKYMDQNIFSDANVAAFYNQHFINLKVDADKSSSYAFTDKFDISGLPALLILDENGELLGRSDGAFTDIDEFIDFGQAALYQLHPETGPWHESRVEYQNGERSLDFLVDHAFNLVDAGADDIEIEQVVQTYWSESQSSDLLEENNLLMYIVFTDQLEHELTKKFMQQKEELIDAYGEDMVNDKLISLISINLYAAIDSRNHHEYEAIKSFTYEAFKDSPTVNVDEILDEVIEIWMEAV
jgi:thiol-disulfide isomerase/thioredoxin